MFDTLGDSEAPVRPLNEAAWEKFFASGRTPGMVVSGGDVMDVNALVHWSESES